MKQAIRQVTKEYCFSFPKNTKRISTFYRGITVGVAFHFHGITTVQT